MEAVWEEEVKLLGRICERAESEREGELWMSRVVKIRGRSDG